MDYFIKEKLNLLSIEEQEMFKKYRSFDLLDLLSNRNLEKYELNNDNAGVISIFADKISQSTSTKLQHDGEIKKHVRWNDPTIDSKQLNDCNIPGIYTYVVGNDKDINDNMGVIEEIKDINALELYINCNKVSHSLK